MVTLLNLSMPKKQTTMSDELERKNIDRTIIDWNEHAEYWDDFDDAKDYTKQIVAVDSSEKMIEVLNGKKYTNVETINNVLSEETIKDNPVLKGKFDLIVAASVCAFLPNYQEVLSTIKSLLKPDGYFVQWDWLRLSNDPDFGFTEEMIREYYGAAGLEIDSITIPFHITENEEKMEVIMAVAKL